MENLSIDKRRAHPRFLLLQEGWIADPDSNLWSPHAWTSIYVLDISQGGFAFFSETPFPSGVERTFHLKLGSAVRRIRVNARIVYATPCMEPAGFRMGACFTKAGQMANELLTEFLQSEKQSA